VVAGDGVEGAVGAVADGDGLVAADDGEEHGAGCVGLGDRGGGEGRRSTGGEAGGDSQECGEGGSHTHLL
jgi:hypothetical protein